MMSLRRARLTATLFVLLLSTAAPGFGTEVGGASDFDVTVAPLIEKLLVKDDIPGLQIAVVVEGKLAWSRGFGVAEVERGTQVSPDTVFRAASVSKLFTATLFLQQVDAGRISLDDDVNAYLDSEHRFHDPGGRAVPVTPRQLLTHTSGLPITWFTWPQIRGEVFGGPPPTLEELLRNPFVTHPPGERIVYANKGYWMLGWLSSRLNDADFGELIQRRVIEPLGMISSSFRPEPTLQARQAIPYGGSHPSYRPVPGPHALPVNPAASLLTTAEDLTRFARMILQGGSLDGRRLLSSELVQQMQRLQARQDPALETGYGLGFVVSDFHGHRTIAHDGYDPGVSSRLVLLPDDGIAVAVLVNATRTASIARVIGKVLRRLTGADDWASEPSPIPEGLHPWLGPYYAVSVLPPSLSWLEPLSQVELTLPRHELRLAGEVAFGFMTEVGGILEPTQTKRVFRFRGAPWDDHRVALREGPEGEPRIFVDILEFRRVPPYLARPIVDGVLIGLAICLTVFLIRALVRRFRRADRNATR